MQIGINSNIKNCVRRAQSASIGIPTNLFITDGDCIESTYVLTGYDLDHIKYAALHLHSII